MRSFILLEVERHYEHTLKCANKVFVLLDKTLKELHGYSKQKLVCHSGQSSVQHKLKVKVLSHTSESEEASQEMNVYLDSCNNPPHTTGNPGSSVCSKSLPQQCTHVQLL